MPLGAEPALVKGVQTHIGAQGAEVVFQLARGQNLSLKLNDDLVDKLQLLMHKMNEAAHWALRSVDAIQQGTATSSPGANTESGGTPETFESGKPPPKVLH